MHTPIYASICIFMFHILNIRTSNLPNLLIIGIRGTQFMSCIYWVPIPIYVSLIRPMHRVLYHIDECLHKSTYYLIGQFTRSIFYSYICNLLFYINKLYQSVSNLDLLVNIMCLVPGSKTVTILFLCYFYGLY